MNSDRLFSGHHLDGAFNRVVETGKLCDSHHGQNFLVMTRSTGNTDYLVILLGLGQDLDQDRNSPAVDVSIGVDFQQDLAGPLIVDILVGLRQQLICIGNTLGFIVGWFASAQLYVLQPVFPDPIAFRPDRGQFRIDSTT